MQEYQLGEVILEREFEIIDINGNVSAVKLLIGKAQLDTEMANAWCTPFQILGIGDEKVRGIFGIDSLQALTGGLSVIKALLKAFAKKEQEKITWLGKDDLGLPNVQGKIDNS